MPHRKVTLFSNYHEAFESYTILDRNFKQFSSGLTIVTWVILVKLLTPLFPQRKWWCLIYHHALPISISFQPLVHLALLTVSRL